MFVIGYSFTVSSNLPRKNPAGALKAFQLAFGDSKNLRLIIRALDISENEIGWSDFRVAVGGDPRVILIENSNDLSINDFYGAIDLYVSPSRSEGYGLNLVEAIQSGVPVLAIGWSLSSDITRRKNVTPVGFHLVPVQDPQGNYTDIVGASWAEPDIVDFAEKMKIYKSRFDANSGSHRNATGAKS
jgi:glycosyltransferase involved in cell wall biosynthesis